MTKKWINILIQSGCFPIIMFISISICYTNKLLCSLTSLHGSVALVLKNLWEIWKVQPQTPVFIKCVDACEKTWCFECKPLSGCLVPWEECSLSFPLSWWRENQRKCLASAKASKIVSPSKKAVLERAVESLASCRPTFLMRNTSAQMAITRCC